MRAANQQQPSITSDLAMEKGLPANVDAERFLIGSILIDDSRFPEIAGSVGVEDFALEKHRRIYFRMLEIHQRGEQVHRVSLANELIRFSELESCEGLSYLVTLDEGMPHIPDLSGYVRIILEKSALRQIAMAAQHMMNRAIMGEEDPDTILSSAEESILKLSDRRVDKKGLTTPLQAIQAHDGGLNSFLDPSKRTKGITTGFTKFDEMTGGMRGGELLILAARPGIGKSSLAMNIAWQVATREFLPVAIFSLEMGIDSLLARMLCGAARVDQQRFRLGYLNAGERQKLRDAATAMVDAPLYIDDTSSIHLADMHAKLRKLKQETGRLGLVIVDYLQLMSGKGKQESRNQEISQISRGLKLMSKELDCPFLVLSQLSRATETRTGDHRPQLSDLRDSGSIEQDADLVGMLFREEVYKRDREDLRGLAELIIAKQRSGPIGKVEMTFLHSLTKFENRAEDLAEDTGQADMYGEDR